MLSGIGANILRDDDHTEFADRVARSVDEFRASGNPPDDPISRHFAQLARESDTDLGAVVAILRRRSMMLSPEELAKVHHDVLVVIGEHDVAGPAEPLADALANATAVTLPGVDHFSTPKSMGFLDAGLTFLE